VNPKSLLSQEVLNHPRRKVASLDPNHFGRRTQPLGQMHEIPIRTDKSQKLHPASPIENNGIRCANQIVVIHAFKRRHNVSQFANQLRGEVLVQ
jgi:hypothetical protein